MSKYNIMFATLLRKNNLRRFCHTHSKTIFPENKNKNKVIEDLLIEQNNRLHQIWESTQDIKLYVVLFGFLLVIKPS